MAKLIVYSFADGHYVVAGPAPGADIVAAAKAGAPAGATGFTVYDDTALPADVQHAIFGAAGSASHNANIMLQLMAIDAKKTRALTDAVLTGDNTRLQALEDAARLLRGQLVK